MLWGLAVAVMPIMVALLKGWNAARRHHRTRALSCTRQRVPARSHANSALSTNTDRWNVGILNVWVDARRCGVALTCGEVPDHECQQLMNPVAAAQRQHHSSPSDAPVSLVSGAADILRQSSNAEGFPVSPSPGVVPLESNAVASPASPVAVARQSRESSTTPPGDEPPAAGSSGGGGGGGGGVRHYFHLQSPYRTYYLFADSREELDRWLEALENVASTVESDASNDGGSDSDAATAANGRRSTTSLGMIATMKGRASQLRSRGGGGSAIGGGGGGGGGGISSTGGSNQEPGSESEASQERQRRTAAATTAATAAAAAARRRGGLDSRASLSTRSSSIRSLDVY